MKYTKTKEKVDDNAIERLSQLGSKTQEAVELLTDTPHCPSSILVRTNHPLPSTQSLTLFQHKSSGQTYRHRHH